MDSNTRNNLQNVTQDARSLLEQEFAEQLEGTYDILSDGTIQPKPGKHLDDYERLVRGKLVDAIEHIKAGRKKPAEAVDEYTREAAFTFLNRFVALKMLEARGLAQQCVSKGDQSSGFKEFTGLAPGLAELPDKGYRLYLECLFDELSIEVKVLFDRRDPASLLWPRRQALANLLSILNQPELAGVWDQDETIGWVYQYFNSQEERRKMREESAAPRNSRELAVRNQFFTPRYVVEFLTDNTLGRIWYEMRQGNTQLVEQCRYLVRRPTEVFLKEDEEPLEQEADDNLSQEDLLKQPVHIPFRKKKDPRDLEILDPACGSGHFLLYCFDLLLTIYEEAWADEQSPKSEITDKTLRADYPTIEALREAVPGLILRHNLHGIDIDPRCAQIAAFALWMRAQRAFNEFGFDRASRPAIRKTNIVVAEPMPGDRELLKEFTAALEPKLLGQLVEVIFAKMQLAGEAGSLLKIEEELKDSISEAKNQWLAEPRQEQMLLFGNSETRKAQLEFDLSGITDDQFWQEAEPLVLRALHDYSAHALNGLTLRRQLFAEDAARGLAFVDLCRLTYSVVLMNPPFGSPTSPVRRYIESVWPRCKPDILACFIARARELAVGGVVGAITNRTALFISSLREWRIPSLLGDDGIAALADLGHGVLDDALVETAAYVLGFGECGTAIGLLDSQNKDSDLRAAIECSGDGRSFPLDRRRLRCLRTAPVAYWAPPRILACLANEATLDSSGVHPRVGLQTSDDFRFLRLQWEVPRDSIGRDGWVPFAKGGEYSPFADSLHLCVKWHDDVAEQRAFCQHHAERTGSARGNDARREFSYYFCAGLTYSERTTSDLSVRVLPRDCITGTSGPGIFFDHERDRMAALAFMSTTVFRQLLELSIGSGDAVYSGSAARHYTVGMLGEAPCPTFTREEQEELTRHALRCIHATRHILETAPTCAGRQEYSLPAFSGATLREAARARSENHAENIAVVLDATHKIERLVQGTLDFGHEESRFIADTAGEHPYRRARGVVSETELSVALALSLDALIDRCRKRRGPSRRITKKTWFADRRIELVCELLDAHPRDICDAIRLHGTLLVDFKAEVSNLIEWAFNVAFKESNEAANHDNLDDPFDSRWARCGRRFEKDGPSLLTDDPGHRDDVIAAIQGAFASHWGKRADEILREAAEVLGCGAGGLRAWMRSEFFEQHVRRFSKSRRKAPIWWHLATRSSSYSIWLYYHRFTSDTFYKALSDYVKPKLCHERRKLDQLRADAGPEPTRSQRAETDQQEMFVAELKTFAEEIERIAPMWSPNLNDGVIINFAPLWRLVPQHKAWQKECKEIWDKLVAGDYDWAHLAMHLWPERVVPKCRTDASLAIAHGLEDMFWQQDEKGKWVAKDEPDEGRDAVIERLVAERISPAVKAALKSLLEAPAPAGNGKGRKRTTRRRSKVK